MIFALNLRFVTGGSKLKYLKNINTFWKCKTLTSYERINEWFNKSGFLGKKIKHIYTSADILFLDRGHFIDIYNNSGEHKLFLNYHDEFDFSFISPDRTTSRYIPNGGPMIFLFDDDSTFEFFSSDYGVYHLSENALKAKLSDFPKGNFDVEKMFYKVLGTSIVGVELKRYKKTDYEFRYVNKFKAPRNQVFFVKLLLDNGSKLFMKYQTFAFEREDGHMDCLRFDEYLDCIYDKEKCLNK